MINIQSFLMVASGLQSLPFGTLRKAQRALAKTTAESSSDGVSDSEDYLSEPDVSLPHQSSKEEPTGTMNGTKKVVSKRANKHAYEVP